MPLTPSWSDIYKVFSYSFEQDPKSKSAKSRTAGGAGITSPEALPFIRQGAGDVGWANKGALRVGNDFIDLSSVSNRQNRYKEYERLRNMPEIEQVMTVIADEACVAEDTKINTLFYGLKTIKWLKENVKDEFFVYCWDFEKDDFTLGVAYEPRLVKKAKTKKVFLDDGTFFIATYDHLVLLKNAAWSTTNDLKYGDELMPFYKIPANQHLTKGKKNQFPRIFSHNRGWINERQFIDDWKTGKTTEKLQKINKTCRMLANGLEIKQIESMSDYCWKTLEDWIITEGFSPAEVRWLGKKSDHRRVVAIIDWDEVDVYDLSVKDHKNFCGESVVFHNCQKNDEGNVLKIECKNARVKEEAEWLLLNRGMLNLNRKLWGLIKRTCINGDYFAELKIDLEDPKSGILGMAELPPESMYRIENQQGKLIEFQQSHTGPDFNCLRLPVTQATDSELQQVNALRFTPQQIIHFKLGEDRQTFYPYGQSLIEPARGPAHQLRLMEDSMVVYRLTRAPERKVFYIDTGTMPPARSEMLMRRLQDSIKKKKVVNNRSDGASAIEEKFMPPSVDDDIWIPVTKNSTTRIDTLPGAQNLGEIDDTVYFRNKLYISLNFPQNYVNNDDAGSTRITLSSQNQKFARMIERIQESIEDGLWEILDRHFKLLGYPESWYSDLKVKITQSSDWRELSKMEVKNHLLNYATTCKSSEIYSDYDILTKVLKHTEEEAQEIIGRMKIQTLEKARLQIIMSNPTIVGIGVPGEGGEPQMGAETGGPNPMLGPEGSPPDNETPPPEQEGQENMSPSENPEEESENKKPKSSGESLPEPEEEDIKKYNLEIQNYDKEQDVEEIDTAEQS